MRTECSVLYSAFVDFAKCASAVDWTVALLIGVVTIGPAIGFCCRVFRR